MDVTMNNYTTVKSKFENKNENNLIKSNLVLNIANYINISGYTDDSNYYLEYASNSGSCICGRCGQIITRKKGYRISYPLIGVYNNKPIIAKFKKQLYYCATCSKSTVESVANVAKNKSISNEIVSCVLAELSNTNATYKQVADDFSISSTTTIRFFDQMEEPEINYDEISEIGIDEIRFVKSAGNYQCTIYGTDGFIIDVLENRESKSVKKYLKDNYSNLNVVNQDLWLTYKNAALYVNSEVMIVADLFHVVRTGMWDFNRGRVAHVKVNGNPAKLRWRTYTYSVSKLSPSDKKIVKHKISKDPFMKINHQAKEMYLAMCKSKCKEKFNRIYSAFIRFVNKHNLTNYKSTLTMIKNWYNEIINAIESGHSNGVTERRNSDFKQAKRNARGFKNLTRAVKLVKYRVNSKLRPNSYNIGVPT